MWEFTITALVTIVVFGLFIGGLCIGLILTGENKVRRGTCGYDPTKKKEKGEDCVEDASCPLCSPEVKHEDKSNEQ